MTRLLHIFLTLTAALLSLPAAHGRAYKNPTPGRFPILAWYSIRPDSAVTHARYQEMAACGFNISFSHFSTADEVAKALEACQGTGVTQMVMTADLEKNTADVVNRFKHHPMVSGWFLRDEPTTHGFADLRAFRDRVLAADTTHLVYLNLLPNYVNPKALGTKDYREYVQRFADEVDLGLISYDHYPVVEDANGLHLRDRFYENLEDVLAVSRQTGQPMWAFCLSTAHDPYPVATREALRLEAFSNLAYGAQCIQYFTYWNPGGTTWNFHTAPISMDGHRTHVYYLVKDLNQEIQHLARIFLSAQVVSVAHTGPSIPKGTKPLTALPAPF
ncbi:MAG: beta-galactosidase, partial [Bacteroidaceae bacterium]|nr:beta-galactosidase [Bacteroidaceae bacterium]